MHRLRLLLLPVLAVLLAAMAGPAAPAGPNIVVVGHPSVPKLDLASLQRLYTGRALEVAGRSITVVNGVPGSTARQRFLEHVLQQDDDQYRAYWTVRRHVGKGAPPRELRDAAEVLAFVQATPGAVGYVLANEVRPDAVVVVWP